MDAPCEIQGSIHVFRLVNNMCPGKWVHITRYELTPFLWLNVMEVESISSCSRAI